MMNLRDLKITGKVRDALLVVAEGLEDGTLREDAFDMSVVHGGDRPHSGCGTAACIAGWAGAVMNGGALNQPMSTRQVDAAHNLFDGTVGDPIGDLFYPHAVEEWDTISPKAGAAAIHEFLNTGTVDWPRIVQRHPHREAA